MSFSADGLLLFVSGTDENAIAIFNRTEGVGDLTFRQAVRQGQNGVLGLQGVAGSISSEDLKHLYVAGMTGDSLAAFRLEVLITALDFESGTIDDWISNP
jgi:6-phosphogluconolactonase (cycloisomerase 2 family)